MPLLSIWNSKLKGIQISVNIRYTIIVAVKGDDGMKVVSIEPTPSPHSMKINVTIKLPDGAAYNFKQSEDILDAPDYIQSLFTIKDIFYIYRDVDFISVSRLIHTS